MGIARKASVATQIVVPRPLPGGRFLSGHLGTFRKDPLAFVEACREHGPWVRVRLGPRTVHILHEPSLIEEVLVRKRECFRKDIAYRALRPVLGEGILIAEGETWRKQRRTLQPAFQRSELERYGTAMVESALETEERWRPGEIRDLHQEMAHLTLRIVLRALFGGDGAVEPNRIGRAIADFMEHFERRRNTGFVLPQAFPPGTYLRALRGQRLLDSIVHSLIRSRRSKEKSDQSLLDELLSLGENPAGAGMTDREIRDQIVTLLLAGHETSALGLSWTWALLAFHHDAAAKLRQELTSVLGDRLPTVADLPRLPYTEAVIRESLRLYPPAWTLSREVRETCHLEGHVLHEKDLVFMSQWGMHRNPRFFPEPTRFLPERWLDPNIRSLPRFAYFPFGGGPRVCLGAQFAMTEMLLVVATLAKKNRFVFMGETFPLPYPSITLRPRQEIPMRLESVA